MIASLRSALRRLRSAPTTHLMAILAIAVGIGLTAAMFSVLRGTFLRPLPFPDAERLVAVERQVGTERGATAAEWRLWREEQDSFDHLTAWFAAGSVVSGDDRMPEMIDGAFVSHEFFDALGVQAVRGRTLLPEDDRPGAPRVAVVSHDLWQERYDGDSETVGRVIEVGGQPTTVVGVTPRGFSFPDRQQMWLPLGPVIDSLEVSGTRLETFGLRRPGVSRDQAAFELDRLADQVLARRASDAVALDSDETVARITPFAWSANPDARRPLVLLVLGALAVLAVACGNVASLLLAERSARRRDLAVRRALGASRRQLLGQELGATLVLAVMGGLLSLPIAAAGIRLYERTGGLARGSWIEIGLDPLVLGLVALLVGVVALLSTLAIALGSTGDDDIQPLQEARPGATASRRSRRWTTALVVAQVAFATLLLTGAALASRSLAGLWDQDYGDDPATVWSGVVVLDTTRLSGSGEWLTFLERLRREVDDLPGVERAVLASHLPAERTGRSGVRIEGAEPVDGSGPTAPGTEARWSVISPGFFELLGRPLLAGRGFELRDDAGRPGVVIVNRSFAERHFPGESPLGERIRLEGGWPQTDWMTVVGVAPDLFLSWDYSSDWIDQNRPEGVYLPVSQHPQPGMKIAARVAAGTSAETGDRVREALARLDPELPLLYEMTLHERVEIAQGPYRTIQSFLATFGAAALLLGAIGLYGLLAGLVEASRRELALRMALGARRGEILAHTLRRGLIPVALGLTVGLGLSALSARLLAAQIYSVSPWDPVSFGAVAVVLGVTALTALAGPGWRASRIDPVRSLD